MSFIDGLLWGLYLFALFQKLETMLFGLLRKPQQQRILTLRSREECEMAEIANLTGETEDNVRAILSRSRKKLKEMFLKKMNHGL